MCSELPSGTVVEVAELVGSLNLSICGGRIHEDDLNVRAQQASGRSEDLRRDLTQRAKQEVHRRMGGVRSEARAALEGEPLGDPAVTTSFDAGSNARCATIAKITLWSVAVQPLPVGYAAQCGTDAEAFPESVQHPRPTRAAECRVSPPLRSGRRPLLAPDPGTERSSAPTGPARTLSTLSERPKVVALSSMPS